MVFYNDRKMCRKCNGRKGEIRMSPMINYQLYYERFKQGLEDCWGIATDNSITAENKVKMIRDISRTFLDGEPTTADKDNNRFNGKEWSIQDKYTVRSKIDRRMSDRNKKK